MQWESLEIRLAPKTHGTFLRNALRMWNLVHPDTGDAFPKILPATCFPSEPDTALRDRLLQIATNTRMHGKSELSTLAAVRWLRRHLRSVEGRPVSSRSDSSTGSTYRPMGSDYGPGFSEDKPDWKAQAEGLGPSSAGSPGSRSPSPRRAASSADQSSFPAQPLMRRRVPYVEPWLPDTPRPPSRAEHYGCHSHSAPGSQKGGSPAG